MEIILETGYVEPKKRYLKKQAKAGFILGARGGILAGVINPSGDWTQYAPVFEPQAYTEADRWIETNNCTGFGISRSAAALMRFMYGKVINYSERFLGIVAGTNPAVGNDPYKVGEAARDYGFLNDFLLPFSADIMTREQYYSPRPMTQMFLRPAADWKLSHKFNHEAVFKKDDDVRAKHAMLKIALTKGPVAVSVKAWKRNDDTGLYYKSRGESDTHWTWLMRFDGENPIVGDSYLPYEKKLTSDYDFNYAEWYAIDAETETIKRGIMSQIIAIYKQVIALLTQQIIQLPVPLPPVKFIPPDDVLPPITPPAPPAEPKGSKIPLWARAISKEEGFAPGTRSWRNNNPGNIKWSSLIQSLGATSKDPNGFAVFPTYDAGFNALCDFLKLGCLNQLRAFHQARTLEQFTQVYALPPANHPYAANVARALGVSVKVDIKTLL